MLVGQLLADLTTLNNKTIFTVALPARRSETDHVATTRPDVAMASAKQEKHNRVLEIAEGMRRSNVEQIWIVVSDQ
jgi:hypothetical protein